jgi:hypothetical protein
LIANSPLPPFESLSNNILVWLSKEFPEISTPPRAINSVVVKLDPPTFTRTILSFAESKLSIVTIKFPSEDVALVPVSENS